MTEKKSLISRAVLGLWDSLNFTRRLIFNLFLLLILGLFVFGLLLPQPTLQARNTLLLQPSGALVEQFSSDPVERAIARMAGEEMHEVQLRDLLRVIDSATRDARIERLVLRPDGLVGGGLASLHEVREALLRFKGAGKQVIAFATGMDQRQYLLASVADQIWLDPEGAVLLEGLSRYRLYYREALQERLKVDVNLFRVGEYKAAAEPYILDGPSPESQQADRIWMNDLWQRYLAEVAAARGVDEAAMQLTADDPAGLIEQAGGQLAHMALQQNLVDALKTEAEARLELIAGGVADLDTQSYRHVDMETYLGFLGPAESPFSTRPAVAVVVAEGDISRGEQPPGQIGGDSTSALLRNARLDDGIRAVVLRVDSPGGEAYPSEQIRREIELLQQAGKPVVASMGNVAASGGYMISMNADKIYASASTITGSIGIYALVPTVQRTLESIGARVGGVGTTPLAGAFDLRRQLDPQLARIIQSVIDRGYTDFIGKVAEARGRSIEEIDRIARGRVWSGGQALKRGLIDALGGLDDAIADAAERAKLEPGSYDLRYVEEELSPFARFLTDLSAQSRLQALLGYTGLSGRILPSGLLKQVGSDLDFLTRPVTGPLPARILTHCFCDL